MALQQHLCHTRCAAKVAVYLEGRVYVPKIIGCTILQQVAIKHVRVVAVM